MDSQTIRGLALEWQGVALDDEAASRLDDAIDMAAETRSPVLSGALHEARARVALAADDSAANIWHATQATQLFQDSRNPALIAQGERLAAARELAEDDRDRTRIVGEDAVTASTARAVQYGTELLSECRLTRRLRDFHAQRLAVCIDGRRVRQSLKHETQRRVARSAPRGVGLQVLEHAHHQSILTDHA